MGKLFADMNEVSQTPVQKLEKRYKSSLMSLLLITAFSGINLLLLLINSDKYFLFSAYIPYLLGDYAMFFGGRYPESGDSFEKILCCLTNSDKIIVHRSAS
mgnify:CR=1 FL=1